MRRPHDQGAPDRNDGGDDVFLHSSNFVERVTPAKGMRVQFTIGLGRDGRRRAQKVQQVK